MDISRLITSPGLDSRRDTPRPVNLDQLYPPLPATGSAQVNCLPANRTGAIQEFSRSAVPPTSKIDQDCFNIYYCLTGPARAPNDANTTAPSSIQSTRGRINGEAVPGPTPLCRRHRKSQILRHLKTLEDLFKYTDWIDGPNPPPSTAKNTQGRKRGRADDRDMDEALRTRLEGPSQRPRHATPDTRVHGDQGPDPATPAKARPPTQPVRHRRPWPIHPLLPRQGTPCPSRPLRRPVGYGPQSPSPLSLSMGPIARVPRLPLSLARRQMQPRPFYSVVLPPIQPSSQPPWPTLPPLSSWAPGPPRKLWPVYTYHEYLWQSEFPSYADAGYRN